VTVESRQVNLKTYLESFNQRNSIIKSNRQIEKNSKMISNSIFISMLLIFISNAFTSSGASIESDCHIIGLGSASSSDNNNGNSNLICNIFNNSSMRSKSSKRFGNNQISQLVYDAQSGKRMWIRQSKSILNLDYMTGDLTWLNKYQPRSLRWSQLCPSRAYQHQQKSTMEYFYCSNYETCDLNGVCSIEYAYNESESIKIHLADSLSYAEWAHVPKFPQDVRVINLSVDVSMLLLNSDSSEVVLLESTDRLDPYTSKANRKRNKFLFEQIRSHGSEGYCGATEEPDARPSPFSIRYDQVQEKLYLKLVDKNRFDLKQKQTSATEPLTLIDNNICMTYNLTIKRENWPLDSAGQSSSIVIIKLVDDRYERPIFDYTVYNFTIVENSSPDTLIGRVNAFFLTKKMLKNDEQRFLADSSYLSEDLNESRVKYRIVPPLLMDNVQIQMSSGENDELSSLNGVPVRVDKLTGVLTQKLNIDREKYLIYNLNDGLKSPQAMMTNNDGSGLVHSSSTSSSIGNSLSNSNSGLLRLNIEASFASIAYSYAQVNIFIKDINDNAPVGFIRVSPSFAEPKKQEASKRKPTATAALPQHSFYISENTPVNQIVGDLNVFDPDAGENGTVKSIDLTILEYRRADANKELNQERMNKLANLNGLKEKLSRSRSPAMIKLYNYINKNVHLGNHAGSLGDKSYQAPPIMPVRLNKINEKIYTIQLTDKLDHRHIEQYTIEMRIQDNGTRPQLESKSLISISVLDENSFPPVFAYEEDLILIDLVESPVLAGIDGDQQESYNLLKKITINGKQVDYNKKLNTNENVLIRLNAIDLDDDHNGLVKYKLMNSSDMFFLNETSGELKLNAPIIRDNLSSDTIELFVSAYDQPTRRSTQLSTTLVVKINVLDLNTNLPKLGQIKSIKYKANLNNQERKKQMLNSNGANYRMLASSLPIEDIDTYETNSENFFNIKLNKTNGDLMQEAQSSVKTTFLFIDEQCFKSFQMSLASIRLTTIDADVNVYELQVEKSPFMFLIDREEVILNNRHTRCQMSIWMDSVLMQRHTVESRINGSFKYELTLNMDDYGSDIYLKSNTMNQFNLSIEIEIGDTSSAIFESEKDDSLLIGINDPNVQFDLIENKSISLIELDMGATTASANITSIELISVSKLIIDTSGTSLVRKTTIAPFSFKLDLIKNKKLKITISRTNESNQNTTIDIYGVYLLDLIVIESGLSIYKQLRVVLGDRVDSQQKLLSLLDTYTNQTSLILANQLGIEQGVYNLNRDLGYLLDSYLYGAAAINRALSSPPSLASKLSIVGDSYAHGIRPIGASYGGLFDSLLVFKNRTSMIKFLILVSILVVCLLALIICCVILVIKRNRSLKKNKKNKLTNLTNEQLEKNLNEAKVIMKFIFLLLFKY
jgi:hypothetical protein